MPSVQRVRWAQLKVGLVASAAFVIAAVLIFLLTGQTSIFAGEFLLRTLMEDSAGMAENATVRLNGISVGHIKAVRLSGSKDPKRTVEIAMMVNQKYLDQIPEDSKAAIAAANLLGDKYINITRGIHQKHVEPGAEIQALQTQDVPQILAQSSNLLSQFQTILGRLDGLITFVDSGQGNIGKFLKDSALYDRANATAAEVEQLIKDIRNSNGTISHFLYDDAFYNDLKKTINRVDDIVAAVQQQKGSVGKLIYDPQLVDEARASITEAKQLLADLNAGKGSAGQLLKKDDVVNQLNVILAKMGTTMDKLNSGPGTMAQLMNNPQLYDALTGTMQETTSLIKAIHADPKKFLRIKLALF